MMRAWILAVVVIGMGLVEADAHAKPKADPLVISETILAPRTDYQAETYSGVPLDSAYAKERGLTKGLVSMVFERQRRPAFRVAHERIKKIVRLIEAAQASVVIAKSTMTTRVDVLDTKDGLVVVETTTTNAGIFTSSDVYVFPGSASPAQRVSAIESMTPIMRERIRAALAIAAR